MTITIRHAEPYDDQALNRIIQDAKVIHGTLVVPHTSIESTRRLIANLGQDYFWLVACVDDRDGEVVGSVILNTNPTPARRHTATLGIAVREDWHGKGVGSALMGAAVDLADNWLNITRLELTTRTDNTVALVLYKKFGFVQESLHQNYVFRDGQFVDVYALARIRPEP